MADYATNLFFASTENERDLDKVEAFLDDNFADCFIERSEDMLDATILIPLGLPGKRNRQAGGIAGCQRRDLHPHSDIRTQRRVREFPDILAGHMEY